MGSVICATKMPSPTIRSKVSSDLLLKAIKARRRRSVITRRAAPGVPNNVSLKGKRDRPIRNNRTGNDGRFLSKQRGPLLSLIAILPANRYCRHPETSTDPIRTKSADPRFLEAILAFRLSKAICSMTNNHTQGGMLRIAFTRIVSMPTW
jgi:hypothetical protein